jgi:hypothetical protein
VDRQTTITLSVAVIGWNSHGFVSGSWNMETSSDLATALEPIRQSLTQAFGASGECEGKGGRETIKPQVFSPALSLTLPLPPTLPSHLAPLPG